MPIYKTKPFARFARKERISDATLTDVVGEAERGLIDADLRGGLIKQRVARSGEGSRGGYRTVLAYQKGTWSVFLFGFAKKDIDNIDDDQLAALQQLAARWFNDEKQLAGDVTTGFLIEVKS